jgi:hypothetical protein
MTEHPSDHKPRAQGDDYAVGYGRPPMATKFKRGKSGNPKGRPKGSRSARAELIEITFGKVPMIVGGRRRYFSRLGAAYLKQWERSIKGDERSTQSFIGLEKALGSLEEPIPTKPSQERTDELIRQLSDEDLELLVKVEEKKKALLAAQAQPAKPRTH